MPGLKPTALLTIDSTKVAADTLEALERQLYGDAGIDPVLPMPGTVITMFSGGVTTVSPTEPNYDAGTRTITIPTVTGVSYYINGAVVPAGPVTISTDTVVQARPNSGFAFTPGVDNDWFYDVP